MCILRVHVQGHGDKDRNGKIGLKYLRNVENENACEPLMISLFKIVPAK